MGNRTIKRGMLVADKRGTYLVADMENNFIKLLDAFFDNNGAVYYGCKTRFIRTEDLDNFEIV